MAPNLRSSTSSPRTASHEDDETPKSSPRKPPRCSNCGQLRAGHPRSKLDCPFPKATDSNISDALETLHIQASSSATRVPTTPSRRSTTTSSVDTTSTSTTTPQRSATRGRKSLQPTPNHTPLRNSPFNLDEITERDDAARRLRRQSAQGNLMPSESLNSISTTSSAILRNLDPRNSTHDEDDDSTDETAALNAKIVRWQDTVASSGRLTLPNTPPPKGRKKATGRKAIMPGTLNTPSPWSSMLSTDPNAFEECKPSYDNENYPDHSQELSSTQATSGTNPQQPPAPTEEPPRRPNALRRSMTVEQVDKFLDCIRHAPVAAQVFSVPTANIPGILSGANKMGHYARPLDSDEADDDEVHVIIGRSEESVDKLIRSLRTTGVEAKKKGGRVSLGTFAGGAVVGAVATITGLAYA